MDQGVTVGDSAAQVAVLDEKIRTEQENIKSQRDNIQTAKTAIQQMNAQVDQLLGRTDDDKGANRAVQVRKQQARERKSLQNDITQSQKEIDVINKRISQLQEERAPLAAESRKIEAEVGPIKYIAALIYGDNPDANLLERAVRWVIILLVLVFDPLALVLILAAEQTIEWARKDCKIKKAENQPEGWHQEWVPDTENPWHDGPRYELDDGPLTDEQITKIVQEVDGDDDIKMTKFFEDGQALAKSVDDNGGFIVKQHHSPAEVNDVSFDIPVLENEEMWSQCVIDESTPVHADFGPEEHMPISPAKGDMYLRTDVVPNVLLKWNGLKWMEIPITSTDSYVYNPEYIQDLIDRIAQGKYSIDLVSIAEQEQIQQVLHEQSNK